MPKKYRTFFQKIAGKRRLVRQRENGVYEIRCQIDGQPAVGRSKDLAIAKQKFIAQLHEIAKYGKIQQKIMLSFPEATESWLKNKKMTTKPSTFKEYERLCRQDLIPKFEKYTLKTLTRPIIQEYLFSYVNKEKYRTAEKLRDVLKWIFDLCAEDAGVKSPMARITLPYHESEQGDSLSLAEECKVVRYCLDRPNGAASSAILVLLFFGIRKSELASLTVGSDGITVITSKKELKRKAVPRTVPFTPVFKRIVKYIDFEKARTTNLNTIDSTFHRILPERHPHELRYTFITHCKECGVNLEVVMLWDGHEEDKDVKSSKVDRGYTTYSVEYLRAEADKVNYDLPI